MSPQETRKTLIAKTISVIANEGLDKTTTKAITQGTGINEAYIYRNFKSKEDLLSKTFDELNEELVNKILQHVEVMYVKNLDFETRCRLFFTAVWNFLLGNREKCLAFIRYYYSPYFVKYSVDVHKRRYAPVVDKFSVAFRDEANVWMILNHILNVMLDFAVKVYNGQMPNDDDYVEHVFRVVYCSVQQYFKYN